MSFLFEKASEPVIFLTHNVPFNTPLDLIRNEESPRNGDHFGSLITRDMIERYNPLLSIGGHIHENFGKYRLKDTLCINSGFGSDVNTLVELEDSKVKNLKFYGDAKDF